jgi:tRNA nucleotidyltransferase (CCA-adding enzyme)
LQRDLERAGVIVQRADEDLRLMALKLPGNVRAELTMARTETYEKPGKLPTVAPATVTEDLRRRDFSVNAMALSLNPGSRGLLLDPANGAADVEAKLLRILHNYAFVEDPSRLLRATRFASRFHWQLEERTQARYDAAKENNYIEYINDRFLGYEIEQLAYEDDPLHILKAYEKEGWLKVLHPHWTAAKVDTAGLSQLLKTRQQMNEFGYNPDVAPAVLHFLTRRLGDRDRNDIQKLIPNKHLVNAWRNLEDEAKELTKRLTGKEAATPSRAWDLLSKAHPETIAFLEVTGRSQAAIQKIRNFFGKWRQVQQKLPLPEMAELYITPTLPEYPKIADQAFHLLLDGKLRSRTEILKFLKPFAPPPPPPPPPPRRGRAAKPPEAAPAMPLAAPGKRKAAAAAQPPAKVPPAPAPVAPIAGAKAPAGKKVTAPAPKPAPAAKAKKPAKPAPRKAVRARR